MGQFGKVYVVVEAFLSVLTAIRKDELKARCERHGTAALAALMVNQRSYEGKETIPKVVAESGGWDEDVAARVNLWVGGA
jgi:hypothetical protein